MAYVQKENSGTIFVNAKKNTETHPDLTGQALIDGVEYWVSVWEVAKKTDGEPYFKLSFKKKQA